MPGGHPRNAKLGVRWQCGAGCRGSDDARLTAYYMAHGRECFDGIDVHADDLPGSEVVRAIGERKHATRGRTLARRREVVQQARESAQALGWVLTAEERAMLAAFAPEGEAQATA